MGPVPEDTVLPPVPGQPSVVDDYFAAFGPGLVVEATGDAATGPWWEVIADAETFAEAAYPCALGAVCAVSGVTTGDDPMEVLLGQRARFYQVDLEGLTLTAGVVGSASGFSTLVGVADSLQPEADGEAATSAREVDRAEFILGLGDVGSSVSTGRYGVTLGSARVYLEIKQDLERLRVARASGRVLSFESDDAFVSFVLLDQLLDPTSLPADDAFVSVNSESDLVAWLEGFGRVSESPALDIRSGSLRAWDLQIDGDDERTFLCQGGAQCMPLLFTDNSPWVVLDTWEDRLAYAPEANLLLHVETGPTRSLDDFLIEIEPLLSGTWITAIDG